MREFEREQATSVLRVLLIEQNERDCLRLLDALRGGGHVIYSRRHVLRDEIENALQEEAWDVLLLACLVPDLLPADVVDLVQEIAPGLPVVLTIERGGRDIPLDLLESGACDFVFKSNPSRLLAVVERECARVMLAREHELSLIPPESLERLDDGAARFFHLASNIPECYWLVDAESQRVTYVSKGYEQIWGRYVEALYADNRDCLKYVHVDDQQCLADALAAHPVGGMDIRFRVKRPGDGLRWLHARNFPVRDDEGKVVSIGGVATDVTSLIAHNHKIPYFAHFDALTALPNQLMFYDQARRLLALAKRRELPLGLIIIDIDRFHEVNQTLGHISGDELLRQVAGRLSGLVRESDILGRLGGDVFAVLLPDLADTVQAGIVARRFVETLIMPVRVDGQEIFATASIGVVFYPQDGHDAHELVSNAELAVRHAKQRGRNNYEVYSPTLHINIRDRLMLETDLRNATLRNEFVLYYQPKVSCASGRITGVEALIRWQHPRRGIVPPEQFIPLLEETGLIVPVGRWVLREACRQAAEWQAGGLDLPSVAVNLSARQLQSETLLGDVAGTLATTGLKPVCLDLEITESMLMHNAESAIRMLGALKQTGVTLSLDDFGTGYSSLAYLKRFPLDAVKVDRSFVQDIAADSDDASITRAVITMAHHLKLKVVAEGVETAEQLALLISHQCDIIQGYFFARPMPAADMGELLRAEKSLPANLLRSGTRKPMALFVAVNGCDEVISMLIRDGHRVCKADDFDAAMQWFSGNLADVIVCGPPGKNFNAAQLIRHAAQTQPQCERMLMVDDRHWKMKPVMDLAASGLVDRVIHLPVDPATCRQAVEEALSRRHISDEYSRLSHEVEVAERELVRVDEERRRLEAENQLLHAQEGAGYRILQEVVAELPWPVLGVDDGGMLALINDKAQALFAERQIALGLALSLVLPELAESESGTRIGLLGRMFLCQWRPVRLAGSVSGRLLFLEEDRP